MVVMEISLLWRLSGRMQWFIVCLHSRTVMFWQPFCVVVIHCPGWQRTHKHILFDVCHDAVTGEWSWAHTAESIATGRRTCQPFRSSSASYKAVCTQSANAFMAEASYNQLLLILPRICSWSTHDQLPVITTVAMSLYDIIYLSWADDSFLFMCTTCVRHTYTASLKQLSSICTLILY